MSREPLVRFSVLALVATEALFLHFPWKGVHLLPAVMALVLWIAATARFTPLLWALVAAGVINGLVAFRPLAPDRPDNSRGARWEPTLQPGLVLNDIDCRLDFTGEGRTSTAPGTARSSPCGPDTRWRRRRHRRAGAARPSRRGCAYLRPV